MRTRMSGGERGRFIAALYSIDDPHFALNASSSHCACCDPARFGANRRLVGAQGWHPIGSLQPAFRSRLLQVQQQAIPNSLTGHSERYVVDSRVVI